MKAKHRNLLLGVLGISMALAFLPIYLRKRDNEERVETLLKEGEKLLEEASHNAKRAGDLQVKAIQKGEQALALVPQNPAPHLLLARAFLKQGNHVKASDHFTSYLEQTPGDETAYREAGLAFEGRWLLSRDSNYRVEAIKYFENSLLLNPQDPAALYHLGLIYHEDKESSKRDEIWEKLLRLAPDSPEATLARQKQGVR